MVRRILFYVLFTMTALWFSFGCGIHQSRPATIIVPGGTAIPSLSIGFDAAYDPTLDDLVPGYKLVTVAFTNESMNTIQLDPESDRWSVEDRRGRRISAITNLRNRDPDAWSGLEKRLKVLIEYPLLIPMGTTQTIDLLFRGHVNLSEFRAVYYKQANTGKVFKILPREE